MRVSNKVLAVAAIAGSLAAYGGWSVWKAREAAQTAAGELRDASRSNFSLARIDLHAPEGFQPVRTPAAFSDVAVFQGSVWLCGPAGLYEFDSAGAQLRSFRPGFELPPAELERMTAGIAGNSRTQELWISTRGAGLLAFDGKDFRQLLPQAVDQRKSLAVLAQDNGRILFGTERAGVLAFDGSKLEPLHPALSGLNITALAGDENDLWAGAMERGLVHFRAGEVHWIDGLPDKRVLAVTTDSSGRSFAATPLGIAEIVDNKVVREHGKGLFVQALSLTKQGTLLAGTLEDGLVEIPLTANPGRPGRARIASSETGEIRRIFHSEGRRFILTATGLTVDGKPFIRNPESLLTDRNIASLAPDESGRLWIGYFDRGLEILAGERSIHAENGTLYCINRIVHDPARNRTLVATANGLAIVDSSGVMRAAVHKADGLIANHTTDLLIGEQGEVTVATPAGITFWRGPDSTSIYAFHGLVNNHVYSLGRCGGNTIAGTLGGISVLNNGLVQTSYTTANSPLGHNWVSAIASAGSDCFIGTYGAGVIQLDAQGNWHPFRDFKSGFEVNPNAMAVSANAIYAGTLGKGLAVFDRRNSRWTWQTAGLPSLNVTAVAVRGDDVFIGTDNGLVRAPESVLVK